MDEGFFVRARRGRAVEAEWEAGEDDFEIDGLDDTFPLCEAWPEKRARGRAREDPERREAVLAKERAYNRDRARRYGTWRSQCISGGMGMSPVYEGMALRYATPIQMTGKARVVWMTHLAARGPATALELSRLTGTEQNSACRTLFGLERVHAVRKRRKPRILPGPGKAPWQWEITEMGVRHLWLAGWQARKVLCGLPLPLPLRKDVNADPLRAVIRHAREEFLRPSSLAVASEFLLNKRVSLPDLRKYTMLEMGTIRCRVRVWTAQGWVEECGTKVRRLALDNREQRLFRFTEAGEMTLFRHIDAMRRVCGATGYLPEDEDYYWPLAVGEWAF